MRRGCVARFGGFASCRLLTARDWAGLGWAARYRADSEWVSLGMGKKKTAAVGRIAQRYGRRQCRTGLSRARVGSWLLRDAAVHGRWLRMGLIPVADRLCLSPLSAVAAGSLCTGDAIRHRDWRRARGWGTARSRCLATIVRSGHRLSSDGSAAAFLAGWGVRALESNFDLRL